MRYPKISVIMPVYNGAHYLREAIESILNQTFSDFEFIIINDGSTDESEKIIQSYEDDRIVYVKNDTNQKICVTLNKGLDLARGEYIARMDCDDISMPMRFEKQKCFLDKHPSIGIIGSDIIVFGDNIEEKYFAFEHDKYKCKAGLLFNTCFAHPAVMMRRGIIEQHRLRYKDEYRGLEDFELWWRIAQYCEMVNLSEVLLRYRIHKLQETQNVSDEVRMKSKNFIYDRFFFYTPLDKDELKVVKNYCYGDLSTFDDKSLTLFINISKRIVASYSLVNSYRMRSAMKKIVSSAIFSIINKSPYITVNKLYYLLVSFLKGIIPFSLFLRYSVYNIFRA